MQMSIRSMRYQSLHSCATIALDKRRYRTGTTDGDQPRSLKRGIECRRKVAHKTASISPVYVVRTVCRSGTGHAIAVVLKRPCRVDEQLYRQHKQGLRQVLLCVVYCNTLRLVPQR